MKKIGYIGILSEGNRNISGPKKSRPSRKMFTLSYDLEKPLLYSRAKITIGRQTLETDRAVWDTGAAITAISGSMVDGFEAEPYEHGTAIGATGTSQSDIYLATIELPGGIVLHDMEVWGVDLDGYAGDVIIGMDVISKGRLIVDNRNGAARFSFCMECEE